MISRRLLRIKVVHVLYAHFRNTGNSIQQAEKELTFSIEKAYDLYHFLLYLLVEVADYAQDKIETAKQKHRPTKQDLNPNTKFIDNVVIHQMRNNEALSSYIERKKLTWANDKEIVRDLYLRFQESPDFQEYMASEDDSYDAHRRVLVKLFNKEVMHCIELYEVLEEKSIYWNDDIEFVISMIAKTIKKCQPEDKADKELMPLYRDDEDRDYAFKLLRKALLTTQEADELITAQTKNWDIDRIIFMDKLLLRLAITEILEMPTIPIKVTINEYLEVAKLYSSQKSNVFINGVLDKLVVKLKKEDKIHKQGRGLIGEI